MRTEELWYSSDPAAALGRIALTPASWLYAFGWEVYASMYRWGLKSAKEPFNPVICLGNLVVGGSGKTPTTLAIAEILRLMGRQVVLSMSGYGSPRAEAATVAPEGRLLAAEWGDEPAMVRWLNPDIPIIVGRRRVLGAKLAAEHFPAHVLLMDDGFQHLPLRKHVTLLIDERAPRNRRCLPAGPYREPRRNRVRADTIFGEQFQLVRGPLEFIDSAGASVSSPKRAAMLCAIGNPEGFAEALNSAGVEVGSQTRLRDHNPLTAGKLFEALDRTTPIVVTAKDWIKLQARPDLGDRKFVIALQPIEIQPAAEFSHWLAARLGGS